MPALYIITGSNGAGKSTIGPDYLPPYIQQSCNVFDGDKLFIEKQRDLWKGGIRVHKEIKKLAFAFVEETFNSLVETAISEKRNFAYEGHFTNQTTWDIPKRFRKEGYEIHMIFFGLTNVDLSQLRVVARTKEGGHYVDPLTLTSNFYGNLEKLNQYYSIFNTLEIVDTSETEHRVLSVFVNGEVLSAIASVLLPEWFQAKLPALTFEIREYESKRR